MILLDENTKYWFSLWHSHIYMSLYFVLTHFLLPLPPTPIPCIPCLPLACSLPSPRWSPTLHSCCMHLMSLSWRFWVQIWVSLQCSAMEKWLGVRVGGTYIPMHGVINWCTYWAFGSAESRKGSVRKNTMASSSRGRLSSFACTQCRQWTQGNPESLSTALEAWKTRLGPVPEKKSQDLSSYLPLVSISLNSAGLGVDKFPEWRWGHVCLLENIRHWRTKASWCSCDSQVCFSEEVNSWQIGAEGQREVCFA